jgi:hypothetical protein
MSTALISVLEYVASQLLVDVDFLPPPPYKRYVPDDSKLTAANIDSVFNTYLATVRGRWQTANAAGLIALLDAGRNVPASSVRRAIQGFEPPSRFDFRLNLSNDRQGERTTLGRTLASGNPVALGTLNQKIEALHQLRRVDDILIRVLAARRASDITQLPLAEIMAFYRTEGNLDVPVALASFTGLVPSDSPTALSQIAHMPEHPTARGARMWPHLVWLSKATGVYLGFDISPAADALRLKEPALVDWMLQLCGLDKVQQIYETVTHAGASMTDFFAIFSEENWTAAGVATTRAASAQRWQALVNNLAVTNIAGATPPSIAVLPTDPVEFVARVLAEGAMMLRASGGNDTSRYLRYHAGLEQATAIYLRGLTVAQKTSGARYRPLRDAIAANAPFAATLRSLDNRIRNERDSKMAVAELNTASGDLQAWLGAGGAARVALLIDFLETAGTDIWPTWTEHRGNLSRHLQQLDFYRRMFP